MIKNIHLQQLGYFRALASSATFVEAARRSFITPSALTQSVHALERELGARLVERRRAGLRLTEAGRRFRDYCVRVLDETDAVADSFASKEGRPAGRVRAAAFPSVAHHGLAAFLLEFKAEQPRVDAMLFVQGREFILRRLVDDELDAAVVHDCPAPAGVADERLAEDRWTLFARADHPLARARRVSAAQLARHAFVSAQLDHEHDSPVLRTLRELGIAPPVAARVDDLESARRLLLAGSGLAVLPRWMLREELAKRRVLPIAFRGFDRPCAVRLLTRRGKERSPAEAVFLDALRARLPALLGA